MLRPDDPSAVIRILTDRHERLLDQVHKLVRRLDKIDKAIEAIEAAVDCPPCVDVARTALRAVGRVAPRRQKCRRGRARARKGCEQ